MGDPDKSDLQDELERAGWRVERHPGDVWWVHEHWKLISAWRPVGVSIFLTLLVDPQSETAAVDSVWAIAVSSRRPSDRSEADRYVIRVSPRWPERMKEVVAAAAALRPTK